MHGKVNRADGVGGRRLGEFGSHRSPVLGRGGGDLLGRVAQDVHVPEVVDPLGRGARGDPVLADECADFEGMTFGLHPRWFRSILLPRS